MTSLLDDVNSNSNSNRKIIGRPNPDQVETFITWTVPPVCTTAAFVSYQSCRQIFHNFIDYASGNTWTVADGGKFMAEMVCYVVLCRVVLCCGILRNRG